MERITINEINAVIQKHFADGPSAVFDERYGYLREIAPKSDAVSFVEGIRHAHHEIFTSSAFHAFMAGLLAGLLLAETKKG